MSAEDQYAVMAFDPLILARRLLGAPLQPMPVQPNAGARARATSSASAFRQNSLSRLRGHGVVDVHQPERLAIKTGNCNSRPSVSL